MCVQGPVASTSLPFSPPIVSCRFLFSTSYQRPFRLEEFIQEARLGAMLSPNFFFQLSISTHRRFNVESAFPAESQRPPRALSPDLLFFPPHVLDRIAEVYLRQISQVFLPPSSPAAASLFLPPLPHVDRILLLRAALISTF